MKKEVKIILVSGVAITIKEEDKLIMTYDSGEIEDNTEELIDVEFEDLKEIAPSIMSKKGDIWLKHYIATGEYMEYYLTREKITWCYYSEYEERSETTD